LARTDRQHVVADVSPIAPGKGGQRLVDAHFEATASYWANVYEDEALSTRVYRHRRSLALAWIDNLELPVGAPILEVGCGASLMSTTLALRGFAVTAIDRVPAMVDATRRDAAEAGVADNLTAALGDVHSLEFNDECFAFVLALGVLPWLHSPASALAEISRVLQPGGYVLASADNCWALTGLFEPHENPLLHPLREAVKRTLEEHGRRHVAARRNRPVSKRRLHGLINSVGLEAVTSTTFGFGPFTAFRWRLLPDRLGARLYDRLQASADRGAAGVRSAGAQHLFLARKPVGEATVASR
jgi:2-polyprenyl-3-methyl-5-hydroxy-6-metoxy-1,4-benzoquinol methylase